MGGSDDKASEIATGQFGVATREQLLAAGFTERQVDKRLDKGWLIRMYPGVYRLGHVAPCWEADYLAAVLAGGDSAALDGRAAAFLLGIRRGVAPRPEIVVVGSGKHIQGVKVRRATGIDPKDVTSHRGIHCLTPGATLVALAASVSAPELAYAMHEAGIRHGTTPEDVEGALDRRPNAKGARRLRAVIRGDVHVTASRLERKFLRLLKRSRLPLPETNILAGGRSVDCRWAHHKLTVELDSYTYHRSRHAWERDRRREREAYARGDQFRRYTWDDVTERPRPVIRELSAILS
jgi:hypothetical protein